MSRIRFANIPTPPLPPAGRTFLYLDEADSHTKTIDSDGNIHDLTLSGVPPKALIGADGITIISGTNIVTVSGFRDEFVNASGSLQTQIDIIEASDVESVNALTGAIVVTGKGEVNVTVEGQNIVVSGTPHETDTDTDTISNALAGADGITVISGVDTDTITGFRTEFVNASGTLSTEIDDSITNHAADASAHHTRYTRAENDAILGVDGITIISGTNDITVTGFRTEFVNASGSLQVQIDNITASDVESVNSLTGAIDVVGKGEVNVTVEGQNIVVSGTDHMADTNIDTISDAIIGAGTVTVTSGTNTTTISGSTALTGLLHQIAFMKGKDDIMNDVFLNTYGDGPDGSPSIESPAVMPWKSKLVGLSYTNKTAGTKVHIEIQSVADGSGNSPVLMDFDWLLSTVGVRTARKTDFVTDIIFDAGDKISVFLDVKAGSSNPRNVIVILYFEIVEETFEESSENFSGNLGVGVTT